MSGRPEDGPGADPDPGWGGHGAETRRRVLGIGSAIGLMAALILVVGPLVAPERELPPHPKPTPMASPGDPIREEWEVFRTRPGSVAVLPDAQARSGAKPRTLATYRALRAYPGAPPRIPHGLTEDEFRTPRCNTCHERGGFSPRFGAYTPVTPHPEFRQCLQCHVPDGQMVGIGFPDRAASGVCLQCHSLARTVPSIPLADWPEPDWPQIGQRAMEGSPPFIPHDLHLRGNCLVCHGGPGAVAEIRTTHPERANCRQCHVPAPSAEGEFTRPLDREQIIAGKEP